MVRTVITPNKQTVSFEIPQSYIGKEIEVIAFAKDEGKHEQQADKRHVTFTVLHVEDKNFKFNRDEANER